MVTGDVISRSRTHFPSPNSYTSILSIDHTVKIKLVVAET